MLIRSILRRRRQLLVFPAYGLLLLANSTFGQESGSDAKVVTESLPVKADAESETTEVLEKKATVEAAADTEDSAGKSEEQPTKIPEKQPAKKSLQETLQDELLGQAKKQMVNPIESLLERMRNVQERLTKTETDKETRTEQAAIVSEIDRLIEALKNQPPSPPQSSSSSQGQPPPPMGNQPDDNQQAQGAPQPQPQNSQKQEGEKSGKNEKEKQQGQKEQQKPGQTESVSDQARESNSSSAKRPRTAEEEAARQRLAKDVWGNLPPVVRQELLNIFSEKYIPKYDEQLRQYFESLAEQNRD